MAAELGVSRTPVLDAIKRLSVEGLIGIRPRRGCFVLGLTVVDIREIFGLREALETYAADCVIVERRHRELADELEALSRQMAAFTEGDIYTDYDAFIERDRAFHMALVRSAGNSPDDRELPAPECSSAHHARSLCPGDSAELPTSIPIMQRFSPPFEPVTPQPQEPRLRRT